MDDRNCAKIVEQYLLSKNPVYSSKYIIGILCAISGYVYFTKRKISNNSFVNQILIPLSIFLVSCVVIDFVITNSLSSSEQQRLKMLCKLWLNDPSIRNNPSYRDFYGIQIIDMDAGNGYTGVIEGYSNNVDSQTDGESITDDMKAKVRDNYEHDDTTSTIYSSDTPSPTKSNNQVYSVTPIGDSLFKKNTPSSDLCADCNADSSCLLGCGCGTLCSGSGKNPCNLVAPIPGPQWQPQSASTVQERLFKGDYTPSFCPQGGQVLRTAADCKNIKTSDSCNPTTVECKTVPTYNL